MKKVRGEIKRVETILDIFLCQFQFRFCLTFRSLSLVVGNNFFQTESLIPVERKFLVFSHITKASRDRVTFYWAPDEILAIEVQVKKSFFLTTKRLLKTELLGKRCCFSSKKPF